MSRSMFVPVLVDADNHNAQVLNARNILGRWDAPGWQVAAHSYNMPDQRVKENSQIEVTRLWRRHAWYVHCFLRYLKPYDLIFYPGVFAHDGAGLRWRRRMGLSAPVIATFEGLLGDSKREAEYTGIAGHPVFCQHVSNERLKRIDEIYQQADHIIAISPFLAKMGVSRFGPKFSVLPLGIDTSIFYPAKPRQVARVKVVSAGRVESHKRPDLFLSLAASHREVDFVWYGEGNLRVPLAEEANLRGLNNVAFPGNKAPRLLADAFRGADIFVLPSFSEGVPKVTQEAAACGLPIVLFGFYESPSVINEENGFVVWTDDELFEKVNRLIGKQKLRNEMGRRGAEFSKQLDWQVVALKWSNHLTGLVSRNDHVFT